MRGEDFGEYYHRALPANQLAFDGIIQNFKAIAKKLRLRMPKVPPIPTAFRNEVMSDPLVAELLGQGPTAEDETPEEKEEEASFVPPASPDLPPCSLEPNPSRRTSDLTMAWSLMVVCGRRHLTALRHELRTHSNLDRAAHPQIL